MLNVYSNSLLCPVASLKDYIRHRLAVKGQFFVHFDSSPLSKLKFLHVFKKCEHILSLDNARLTSNSYRIGEATEAAKLGFSESLMKKIGRWKSDSFLLYVHPNSFV